MNHISIVSRTRRIIHTPIYIFSFGYWGISILFSLLGNIFACFEFHFRVFLVSVQYWWVNVLSIRPFFNFSGDIMCYLTSTVSRNDSMRSIIWQVAKSRVMSGYTSVTTQSTLSSPFGNEEKAISRHLCFNEAYVPNTQGVQVRCLYHMCLNN